MRPTLLQKYFRDVEEGDTNEKRAMTAQYGAMKEFVTRHQYARLREKIKALKLEHKPMPSGDVGGMNYQLGVQQGIELVESVLESYERAVKEHHVGQED